MGDLSSATTEWILMALPRWDEMTREERAKLMIEDYDTYKQIVPELHWLQILDGIAKLGPYEPEPD